MIKLSRTASYALQATLQLALADSDRPVSCRQLAAQGQMPQHFLVQIMRHLVAHKIVASTRGADGGYALGRRADEISLLEVIEAVNGPLSVSLPVGEGFPAPSRANLERSLGDATADLRGALASIKLSSLLPKRSPPAAGRR